MGGAKQTNDACMKAGLKDGSQKNQEVKSRWHHVLSQTHHWKVKIFEIFTNLSYLARAFHLETCCTRDLSHEHSRLTTARAYPNCSFHHLCVAVVTR
jgi:hypothetical protein